MFIDDGYGGKRRHVFRARRRGFGAIGIAAGEQITALGLGDRRDRPVVQHEHVSARDLGKQAWVASVGACERELGE